MMSALEHGEKKKGVSEIAGIRKKEATHLYHCALAHPECLVIVSS